MKVASVRTRIMLGIFVLAMAVVGAVTIMIAGDDVSLFRRSKVYTTRFVNTAGLVEGAPVRMGGVEIGRVYKITIETAAGEPTIKATLKVDNPYSELIKADATVALETQGVLGDKFVALSAGESDNPLAEGEDIATRENQGLAQVVAKSNDIVDSIASTTKKIDDFAAGLPDAAILRAMIDDLAASAQSLGALGGTQNVKAMQSALERFNNAAGHFESIARKIDEGQGTLGALVNDRTLYEDVRAKLGQADRGRVARRAFSRAVAP